MRYSFIPGAGLVIAGVLTCICTPLFAATVSMNPPMVVADSSGAVVGPVIGIAADSRPLVLIADPSQSAAELQPRGIILRVDKDGVSTESDDDVFYSSTDCTGTPHLRPASQRSGLAEMTDINYVVGLNGSDVVIYKAAGSGTGTAINSVYDSTTRQCTNITSSPILVEATEIINLSVEHPAPYGVVFPGLEE